MASYVFLNSSPRDRMPSGDAGEWTAFWSDGGAELEAKNAIPLLWWCLFAEADLKRARLIDDFDIGDPEREDFAAETGWADDTTYPYLVTDTRSACVRLAARRAVVLDAVGAQYAPVYDGFARLTAERFDPFLLLRTAGLPDAPDAEEGLRQTAAAMDRLGGAPFDAIFDTMTADFRRWRAKDPIWLLSGAGEAGVWPPPDLAEAFPNGRRRADTTSGNDAAPAPVMAPIKPSGRPGKTLKFILEWGAALVVGGSTVGTYLWTSSVLFGALAFAVSVAAVAWLLKSKL